MKWAFNTSGGSTGEPVKFIQDRDYSNWNIANKLFYKTMGDQKIGDKEMRLWGSERDLLQGRDSFPIRIQNFFFNRTDLNSFRMSEKDMHGFVEKTAEKEVISTHGNVGFYCFSKGSNFVKYAEQLVEKNIRSKNEFYVAPLYNLLIKDGLKITTLPIKEQFHMGTPDELDYFLKNDIDRIKNEVW